MQIRLATSSDVPAIAALVDRAYRGYVSRMGRRPVTMDDDYAARVADRLVSVADDDGIVGLIVLIVMPDHLFVDNVAVDPARQGAGIGRLLLDFAESQARHHGLSELRLYTNAAMTENIAYYPRRGYRIVDRRIEKGYDRVFFSKQLGAD